LTGVKTDTYVDGALDPVCRLGTSSQSKSRRARKNES
jgi:hypothetical protein